MRINIYTALNGVGLQRDYDILKQLFESLGHTVDYADWKTRSEKDRHIPKHGDIAFHLEIPRYDLMGYCPQNIMIPNPEWFEQRWLKQIHLFQTVYAKTRDCERIFLQYHGHVIFTSFTSLDKYNPKIIKDKIFVHTSGKSTFKGTAELLRSYNDHKLPKCYLTSQTGYSGGGNIVSTGYLSESDFDILLNACLIHIMPSYYEGFGHAIWEAMATGAVVITTDSPPMNEFITDKRFLVESKSKNTHHLGILNHSDSDSMAKTIQSVNDIPTDELLEIGKANRQKFLDNDKFFREKIKSLLQ